MIDILILIVATEAITELIFKAGPLQPMRMWLIERTPWLYSKAMQSHLLECKYCTSVWVGLALFATHSWVVVMWLAYAVSVSRLANFLHLPFSLLRDVQLNIRIERNKEKRYVESGK